MDTREHGVSVEIRSKNEKDYKKIKDYHNETGRKRRKEWKFFEKMDEILGTKPATRPEVLIDTL